MARNQKRPLRHHQTFTCDRKSVPKMADKRNTKRIIFLDIDGVLVNFQSLAAGGNAHSDCVVCLNRLIKESGAVIVVSSLWRFSQNPPIAEKLNAWGVRGKVIGITPDFSRIQREILIARERGQEIEAWLFSHAPEVESFVILDDDKDMGELLPYLVQTNYEHGLTDADVEKALEILKVTR